MTEQLPEIVYDKSSWGDGPWQSEPDRIDFVAHGFACLMLRHPRYGSWCSYVAVPPGHPAYEKPPQDLDVRFHYSLNYGAKCSGYICHVPIAGMPDDVWWLGGDFAHVFDLSPALAARERALGLPDLSKIPDTMGFFDRYRDVAYVRAVTESLAEQLAEMRPA
jgi:hypothetical protein